ncbi:MAG TPA: DinB family protein [Holophagaceae bacterium]|nr:DinB family protein [Holophagaceae bacterium]
MSQPWTTLFMINRKVLMERNLADITQDQADQRPSADVNSITWILDHVLEYRHELLREVLKSPFRPTVTEPKTLAQFMAALDEAQEALGEAFEVADLEESRSYPVFQSPAPLGQIVGVLYMHETYHLGQVGTARKLLGLPGAIQAPAPVEG